ncbi:MAG TPA: type II restriction endonuclease [Verrucomicrobiae bacterium]|nr:type II restriction endonuclease [Verrucomicrobiae bacterium]
MIPPKFEGQWPSGFSAGSAGNPKKLNAKIAKRLKIHHIADVTGENFLEILKAHTATFGKAVATNEGEWIIKGFIDVYRRIYTISVDTKIVSKVLELLLFPMFVEFGKENGLKIQLCPQQNFYPDLTFTHEASGKKFAVDIKSTYRISDSDVNGMTLGAFTGYFRKRDSNKNTLFPYNQYAGHFVLGVIYSKCDEVADERMQFTLDDLPKIPSVVKDFQFFAQPKYRIASSRPGSGNTKNIGSVTKIEQLVNGTGPFASLGEEVYDDYWMFYLTRDMAQALLLERPYRDLKSYLEYKERGVDKLRAHEKEIARVAEDEAGKAEEENE